MAISARFSVFILAAVILLRAPQPLLAEDPQDQWKSEFQQAQKIERALTSVENALHALELWRKEAVPHVQLTDLARISVPQQLKFLSVQFHIIERATLTEQEWEELEALKRRYWSAAGFFEAKARESTSPAQQCVRLLYEDLEQLEATAGDGDAVQGRQGHRLLTILGTAETMSRIRRQDPAYPLQDVMERFAPHAKSYVLAKQELLEIQPGAKQQRHARYYLDQAQLRIEHAVPPNDPELVSFLEKAEASLRESRELAPDYFNPEGMEETLSDFWSYTRSSKPEERQPETARPGVARNS